MKLHLAGTLGVKTMCIKGPEEMTGRNEERAARATEMLYAYLAGKSYNPGPASMFG